MLIEGNQDGEEKIVFYVWIKENWLSCVSLILEVLIVGFEFESLIEFKNILKLIY